MDILTFARDHLQLSYNYASKLEMLLAMNGILHINGQSYSTKVNDLEKLDKFDNVTSGHVVTMRHKLSGTYIAVKHLRYRSDEVEKMLDDLHIIENSRDCPYLVKYYGYLITDTEIWICTERMRTCLKKVMTDEKHLINEDLLGKVTMTIVEALLFLKKKHGIVHRNVRPSNILMDEEGEVKLCGCWSRPIPRTRRGEMIESYKYLAPEVISPKDIRKPSYDIRTDFWSLGITLLELATQKHPYRKCRTEFELLSSVVEEKPPELPYDAPFSPEFKEFVSWCLTKNYENRPNPDELMKHPFYQRYEHFQNNTISFLYFSGIIKFCSDWFQVFRSVIAAAKRRIEKVFKVMRGKTIRKPKKA